MSAILRLPWSVQPQGAATLRQGGIAAKLALHVPLHPGWGMRDLVSGAAVTRTGSLVPSLYRDGVLPLFGPSNYVDPVAPAKITSITQPLSIAWIQQFRSFISDAIVFQWKPPGATNSYSVYQTAGAYQFQIGEQNGNASNARNFGTAFGTPTNDVINRCLLVLPGGFNALTSAILYKNGVSLGVDAAGSFGVNTTAGFRVGANFSGGANLDGLIGEFSVFDGALSASEAAAYFSEPYPLYAPRTSRIWVPVSEAKIRGPKTLTRVRTSQPQVPTGVDLARSEGLAFAANMATGRDERNGKMFDAGFTLSSTVNRRVGKLGRAFETAASAVIWPRWKYSPAQAIGSGDFTFTILFSCAATGTAGNPFSNHAGTNQWRVQTNYLAQGTASGSYTVTSGALSFLTYSDSTFSSFGASGMLDGLPHVFTFIRRGTTHTMLRDGIEVDSRVMTVRDITGSKRLGPALYWQQLGDEDSTANIFDSASVIYYADIWARAQPASEAASRAGNLWQVFAPVETPVWLTEGSNGVFALPAIELNSAAAATASATAALTTAIALAATPAAVAAMTATLAGDTALAATPASQASATAALTTAIRLAAAAAGLATAPSALGTGIVLAAAPAALATASTGLTTAIVLTAAPAALATVTAALTTAVQLTAAPAALATATAALTTTPSGIAADPAAQAAVTAALTTTIRLAAAPAALVTATAALTTAVVLSAAPAALATGTAALTTTIRLAAAPAALAAASGALATAISLAAAPAALVTASADLTAPGSGLAAAPAALATATASLTTGVRLNAAASSAATATANLLTAVMLSSSAQVQAQSTANLTAPGATWSAAAVAQAIAAANLTTAILLAAQASASASATSFLTVNAAPAFSPSPSTQSWVAERKPRNWVVYGD